MFGNFKKSFFLKNDLEELEKYIKDFVYGFNGILRETLSNTLLAGGKRIRPALFLICAKSENYDIKRLIPAAAAIEFLHTASLIHDDIIDKSLLRRGKKTIHNIYDKDTARYVGDYLFTYAFYILNTYNDYKILREISETSQLLVFGEFDQIKTKKILDQNEETYLEKINEKTSSLFKLSCVLGGILSGSSDEDIENLRRFGQYLGIAFQINDDLIDINIKTSEEKPDKLHGNDIRQGNITLPLIYTLKNKKIKAEIKNIIGSNVLIDEEKANKIISLIYKTNAIKIATRKIYYYLNEAKKIVKKINNTERKNGLIEICNLLLNYSKKF
ncbi:MAG: polyprenyl synthetase family protein [Actinobacteria bacterium]|nr:polyprenyl synthetase family protein [Actinomycetota bacterium]